MNTSIPITERAWAAGFFDGEGCTSFYKTRYISKKTGIERTYFQPKICVTQKDPRVLYRLKKALGKFGGICRSKFVSKGRKNPMYQLQIDGFEKVQVAIAIMWPYLDKIKRTQAKKVLQTCALEFRSRLDTPSSIVA